MNEEEDDNDDEGASFFTDPEMPMDDTINNRRASMEVIQQMAEALNR